MYPQPLLVGAVFPHLDVREDLAHVLKLVCGLLEGQVGVVEVESVDLTHEHLRNVRSKLDQQLQLQRGNKRREVITLLSLPSQTHVGLVSGCGLSEVHHQLEDLVRVVAHEHGHRVIEQLL